MAWHFASVEPEHKHISVQVEQTPQVGA